MLEKYIIKFINEDDVNYAKKLIEKNFKDNYKLYNYYMGLCCCCEKKYFSAIYHFNEAIKNGLINAVIYYNLGTAYLETGNYKLAKECFLNCIELDFKFTNSYINLAYIYYINKDFKAAYRIIKLCLSYSDDDKIKDIEKKLLNLICYL